MKKFAMMILILIVGLVVSLDVVKAAESQAYFTSDNGIELTEKEYNFILLKILVFLFSTILWKSDKEVFFE